MQSLSVTLTLGSSARMKTLFESFVWHGICYTMGWYMICHVLWNGMWNGIEYCVTWRCRALVCTMAPFTRAWRTCFSVGVVHTRRTLSQEEVPSTLIGPIRRGQTVESWRSCSFVQVPFIRGWTVGSWGSCSHVHDSLTRGWTVDSWKSWSHAQAPFMRGCNNDSWRSGPVHMCGSRSHALVPFTRRMPFCILEHVYSVPMCSWDSNSRHSQLLCAKRSPSVLLYLLLVMCIYFVFLGRTPWGLQPVTNISQTYCSKCR